MWLKKNIGYPQSWLKWIHLNLCQVAKIGLDQQKKYWCYYHPELEFHQFKGWFILYTVYIYIPGIPEPNKVHDFCQIPAKKGLIINTNDGGFINQKTSTGITRGNAMSSSTKPWDSTKCKPVRAMWTWPAKHLNILEDLWISWTKCDNICFLKVGCSKFRATLVNIGFPVGIEPIEPKVSANASHPVESRPSWVRIEVDVRMEAQHRSCFHV